VALEHTSIVEAKRAMLLAVRQRRVAQSAEALSLALEPPPFGAGWPEVVRIAETILVYESEAHEAGPHFYLLLAYDAEGNEVGRKRLTGWGDDAAEGLGGGLGSERRWICLL
jgi:hypothetical protein